MRQLAEPSKRTRKPTRSPGTSKSGSSRPTSPKGGALAGAFTRAIRQIKAGGLTVQQINQRALAKARKQQ